MPGTGTNEDLDLELDGDETTEPEADGGDAGADGAEGEPDKPVVDKRISDLQSERDKATARANKAEKLLEKLNAGEGADSGSNDPERTALLAELRETSLDAVYGEYSELKDYGIDRALIEGRTRAEMRESATALVGLIKSVATKARNKALQEAGVKADPTGATRQPPKNYGAMSEEDFEKEIARARSGGAPIW